MENCVLENNLQEQENQLFEGIRALWKLLCAIGIVTSLIIIPGVLG